VKSVGGRAKFFYVWFSFNFLTKIHNEVQHVALQWLLELLAPRRNAISEDKDLTLACISWPIHLCIGSSNGGNWIIREADILANTEKCIQTQH
jgi:hypothetical protein